ncbi:MAG: hypothetical protein A2075_13330 [Geobacteraceae bacterium GWC2_58_44]|nr:MAG: hypothetical protein A2075_13330 [Geobacteraceae bacterium GWC2_58_44]HBG08219.1 hypothetical protein [Geobacter sp.]
MKLGMTALRTLFLILLLLVAGISTLCADTVSWPVSVAIPTALVGELDSRPVSVGMPALAPGEVSSKPVSVSIPAAAAGETFSRPVSVSLPVTAADASYLGKPVSVAIQSAGLGDSDLVGLWHMDGDWGDSSGNGNSGTAINAASFDLAGKIGGGSGSFDGSSGYLSIADSASLELASAATLEAWVKTDDVSKSQQVISKFGTSGSFAYQLGLAPSGNLRLDISDNGTTTDQLVSTTSPISAGSWHHVAASFNAGALKLYVDGVQVAGKNSTITMLNAGNAALSIGANASSGEYFNGLIDEAAIYRRCLTAEEIAFHFSAAVSDPSAPPAPQLAPLASVVGQATVALSGTRVTNSSIWVNNRKIAALGAATGWLGSYGPLQPGLNLLRISAVDGLNRQSPAVTRMLIYDTVPPVIEASVPAHNSNGARVVGSVSITLTDADSSLDLGGSVQGATVKNSAGQPIAGTWSSSGLKTVLFTPTTPFPADTYTVTIHPLDSVGNRGEQQIVFTNHDTSAPSTEITLSGSKGGDGWYYTPVSATLSATDSPNGSGVARIEYSFDNVTWLLYDSPVVVAEDGRKTLYFRGTDGAGNRETPAKSKEIPVNKSGLVGQWHLDNDWSDASLFGNEATPYNGAKFGAAAKIGASGGSFDGVDDGVKIADAAVFQAMQKISVEAWIKPERIAAAGTRQTIVSFKEGSNPSVGAVLALPEDAPNRVRFWVQINGVWRAATGSTEISANANWYHVTGTYDGSSLRVYLDGQLDGESSFPGVMTNAPGSATCTITIGANAANNGNWYQGTIDEVALYNRALSGAEVQQHYNNLAVASPTLQPVASPTSSSSIVLSGTKPADTAIVLNGETVVPLNASTSWQADYTLSAGSNILNVTAMDGTGFNSFPTTLSVILDLVAPQVTGSVPREQAVTSDPVNAVSIVLTDAFSAVDLAATTAAATVKNSAGLEVPGSWSSAGSGVTGTVTFTPAFPLAEGSYSVTINPADTLNNGSAYSLAFAIDSTPPALPGIDPIAGPVAGSVRTVTGTRSSDSAQVLVSCAAARIDSVGYPTPTTWRSDISNLTEGSNTVSAQAVDAAGNRSGSAQMSFVVDLTPPQKPSITPLPPTRSSSALISGAKGAGSYLYLNGLPNEAPFNATTWSATISLAEGSNAVSVHAADEAGNLSQAATLSVLRDTIPPVIAASTPSAGSFTAHAPVISVTLGDGAASGADLAASLAGAVLKDGAGAVVHGSWSVSAPSLLFTPSVALADGSYAVTLFPVDHLGNKGNAAFGFTLDRVPATVQGLELNPASPVKAGTVQFTVTFSEPMNTALQPAVSFAAGSRVIAGGWLDGRNWRGSFSFTGETGDASYSVKVGGARDLAGNTVAEQTAGSFLLDTVRPPLPAVNPVTSPTREAFQLLAGSKPAHTAVVINGSLRVPLGAGTAWSYSYPLSEGANPLLIAARDAAGNDSAAIAPAPVVTMDTTPPLFTVELYQDPASTVTQTISGKKEPGSLVKLNGATIFDATDQSGSWSYELKLTDGISNRLIFSAADPLGNSSSKTLEIVCDSAPPQPLAAGMLSADGSGRGSEVLLSWPSYPEPANLAYYRLYYASNDFSAAAGLTPVATLDRGSKQFRIATLTRGTRYYFAVVPVSLSGSADPSLHTVQAVPANTLAPEEATGLSAWAGYSAAEGNFITLSWSASANSAGELTAQTVYTDAGEGYDAGSSLGRLPVSFTAQGLKEAGRYKFKLTQKDAAGRESAGVVIEAVTRLANPAGVSAAPGDRKVTLSWSPVASPYLKSYNIYRLASGAAQHDIGGMTLIRSQSGTGFIDAGVDNGTAYQYAVTTMNSSGAQRNEVVSVGVTPRGDSSGPAISASNLTPNQVITAPLTITASAQDAESAVSRISLFVDNSPVRTENGASLSWYWNMADIADGPHAVKVVAYDTLENAGEISVPVLVSLLPPAVPVIGSAFSAPISRKSVTVSGTAPRNSKVTLRVNGVVTGQSTAATEGGSFTFSELQLVEGDNLLAVKAGNRSGESSFSPELRIVVDSGPPPVPANLTAKPLSGGSIQFAWENGVGEQPVGYHLYQGRAPFISPGAAGVTRTNAAPIPYLLKEYLPADDSAHHYAVTALDGAGNESPLSQLVFLASDRSLPAVSELRFAPTSGEAPVDSVYGPGSVKVVFSVSEPLKEAPFLSLEPAGGSPIMVAAQPVDQTHYQGIFTLDAASPQGANSWKFSGRDLAGNRGSASGSGIVVDTRGPLAALLPALKALKSSGGPVQLSFTMDEPSVAPPVFEFRPAVAGSAVAVTGVTSADNGTTWTGELDPSTLPDGAGQFYLTAARDRFGNSTAPTRVGSPLLVYKTTPPAPAVPVALGAKPAKGGRVMLRWTRSSDASGFLVYRRGANEAAPALIATLTDANATGYDDLPASDGSYLYSVSALGLMNSESARCAEVTAASDRTAPPSPGGIVPALTGNGVEVHWTAAAEGEERGALYRLYRGEGILTDISGAVPVSEAKHAPATDTAPSSAYRFYAVTALDAAGNESAASESREISFPVAPVQDMVLARVDQGKPSLSWKGGEANLQGFHIYRNGSRITTTPTLSTSFSDGYYTGGGVSYGVSAVNALGTESPVKEVTLPPLAIALKEGSSLRRGQLESIALIVSLPAESAAGVEIDSIALKIGSLPESRLQGPFALGKGGSQEIAKVASTESTAPPQVALIATALLVPSPGTTVSITKSSPVPVLGSGSALEIYHEPLKRGSSARVRIKVNNLGSARSELVTSENSGPSGQVTVSLKDQDGNLLAKGALQQQTGAVVNSGGYATARIEPGGSFLSDPVEFMVPSNAPDKVVIEAQIDKLWYAYNQPEQVEAPGVRRSLVASIIDVAYNAAAQTDKPVYQQGEAVIISGRALGTGHGQPMPIVPVKIGISVDGFDRSYQLTTDQNGAFRYTFQPGPEETGSYSVWACNPELSDRSVQAGFDIMGLSVTPEFAQARIARNQSIDIPVTLRNLSSSELTGLDFSVLSSSGIAGSVVNGGNSVLAGGESRPIVFRLTPQPGAPDSATAELAISTSQGFQRKVSAHVTLVTAIPLISTSPSYLDTGLLRDSRKLAAFSIGNSGIETLLNPRIDGPALPWIALAVDRNPGDIAPGESREIGVIIRPDQNVAPGIYSDRLTIYSDNHIPYTFNIQVTVSSNAVGNVQFNVLNELMKDVAQASVTIQNQSALNLIYSQTTGADGSVTFFDIPEGRYSYNIGAPGTTPTSGSFVVQPGITVAVPVAMEVKLVTVEWSVTPVLIEDRYDISITQTFETNVPTPVLVSEPANITIPALQPGQVFNGEYTVTNYGLIAVDDANIDFPVSFGEYDIEVLASAVPKRINAGQKIRIAYRVTRRETLSSNFFLDTPQQRLANLFQEVRGFGGSSGSAAAAITVKGKAVICPKTPQEKTVDKFTTHSITSFGTGDGNFFGAGGGGGWGGSWSGGFGGFGDFDQQPGAGGSAGVVTPLPSTNPCDCKADGTSCPGEAKECFAFVCKGGNCVEQPDDDKVPFQAEPGDCKKQVCKGGTVVDENDDSEKCGNALDPAVLCKGDYCREGSCIKPPPDKPCDDGSPCTQDKCGTDGCEHTANDNAVCDDAKFCTSFEGNDPGIDSCRDARCVGEKIADKTKASLVQSFNFAALEPITALLGKIIPIGDPQLILELKGERVDQCCEKKRSIVSKNKTTLTGQLSFPINAVPLGPSFKVPGTDAIFGLFAKGALNVGMSGSVVDDRCTDQACWGGSGQVGLQATVSGGGFYKVDGKTLLEATINGNTGIQGQLIVDCVNARLEGQWDGITVTAVWDVLEGAWHSEGGIVLVQPQPFGPFNITMPAVD